MYSCPEVAPIDCTFNYDSDTTFDLSGLEGMDYDGSDDSYDYKLGVCEEVIEDNCNSNSGAVCQYLPSGRYVHMLASWELEPTPIWDLLDPSDPTAGVSIYFENGDFCAAINQPRQVTFNLPCDQTSPNDEFTIEEDPDNPCEYVVTFYTSFSCPRTDCTWESDGYTFDLDSLYTDTDYSSTDGEYDYSLNVCGVSNEATCNENYASLCQYADDGTFMYPLASWVLTPSPVFEFIDDNQPDEGLIVYFNNGDLCYNNDDEYVPRSVSMTFPCDPDSSGDDYDIFNDGIDPCVYNLTFPTRYACPTDLLTKLNL